jgi:hypothetical protein
MEDGRRSRPAGARLRQTGRGKMDLQEADLHIVTTNKTPGIVATKAKIVLNA